MTDIELIGKKSFSQNCEESKIDNIKLKISNNLKFFYFAIFVLIIILFIINCLYQNSYSKANKAPFVKEKNLKKLDEIIVVPYESPNKMESMLDYLLYPYHSEIIKNLDDYEFIRDALGKISLKMVFNSNFHGDYALDVHNRANYHHILVLIETENGNRFGGYTSDNFTPATFGLTSTSIELYKRDTSAFLFNLDSKKIFNIKPKEALKALDCDDYFTLCFGEGDLLLRDQFLTNGGMSDFPYYYGDDSTKENELTNGEKEFNIKAFEVYNVLFFSEFGDEMNRMGVHKNYVK